MPMEISSALPMSISLIMRAHSSVLAMRWKFVFEAWKRPIY